LENVFLATNVVSLTIFENPYGRSVRPQAKEMIRNWIELKTEISLPTYQLWMKFAWMIGLSYWFATALLVSIFSKFIDTQILIGLFVCVVFRMWIGNIQSHCISLWLYLIYFI
jgi:hypothetical protein